jgi:hypothetical protein
MSTLEAYIGFPQIDDTGYCSKRRVTLSGDSFRMFALHEQFEPLRVPAVYSRDDPRVPRTHFVQLNRLHATGSATTSNLFPLESLLVVCFDGPQTSGN